MGTNQIQCLRPCYDCPFRKDIVPYQREEDVLDNLAVLTNLRKHALCHHTSDVPGGQRNSDAYGGKKLVCAGFLVMRQKLGLELPTIAVPIPDRDYVFGSIKEFAEQSLCPDQSWKGRAIASSRNQPRSKLLKYYARALANIDMLVEQSWWNYLREQHRGDYY